MIYHRIKMLAPYSIIATCNNNNQSYRYDGAIRSNRHLIFNVIFVYKMDYLFSTHTEKDKISSSYIEMNQIQTFNMDII